MNISVFSIILLIFTTSVFDTINQLFLKSSIDSLDENINSVRKVIRFIYRLLFLPKVWFGFTFCCISLLIWLFVLSKADLNFAFSADSMHYILIAFASRIFLKEKVGFKRWLGTLFIILGIVLMAWSNTNGG